MLLAVALWAGFIDEMGVDGPRPRTEIAAALASARPALESCARAEGIVAVELHILAAGFVDRVDVFSAAGDIDVACARNTLRALQLADRGKEPPTRVYLHVAATPDGRRPKVVPFRSALAAIDVQRDALKRCAITAKVGGPMLLRFDVRGGSVSGVEVVRGLSPDADACVARVASHLYVDVDGSALLPLRLPVVPADIDKRGKGELGAPTFFRFIGCM
jgi:hypothetical protein